MSRLLPLAGVLLLWALNVASCDASVAPGGACPCVDVKFRAGVSLEHPLDLLPRRLRAPVRRVSPLFTLGPEERARIGANEMARWFRLELASGTDVGRFVDELTALDVVEVAERSPEPAPDPGRAGRANPGEETPHGDSGGESDQT